MLLCVVVLSEDVRGVGVGEGGGVLAVVILTAVALVFVLPTVKFDVLG